ncbi:Peptidoglycan/LPS O-acetylase OafA/YrhL, contains acyltransferase and SGNH-hydrolase domains [Luteibacter sp. UNC138MFCol5.1]|uniref:acyltransferase family protein n=1 Tax=Luteibacter sp. UNC138MFCol5.1 TaxID=1502774 RepID=UPI0008B50F25|nr:acyltransferase [Luteibacter sp. UNC138MFCol5.1]SEO76118.1 Peptidoglycan/LPS O-acetylase OafA/YrhL, contains acyltransferase and SGNH-hydrolase domains [Luteibacter sp. UNC138MFCol5.1]
MQKDKAADGLRGIAALNVLLCHMLIAIFPLGFAAMYPGTALPGAPNGRAEHILAMPIVPIFLNGHFAVCVFFVLSGYVLTKKFLVTGDLNILKLRAARRYVRLGVPILGSVLFAYACMSIHASWGHVASELTRSSWLGFFWHFDPHFPSAIADGAYGAILTGTSLYNMSLWTMKIELIGSMIVFAYVALRLSGIGGWIWFAVVSALLFQVFPADWPYYMAFLIGSHVGVAQTTRSPWVIALCLLGVVIGGSFDLSPLYDWTLIIPLDVVPRESVFHVAAGALLLYVVRCGFFDAVFLSRGAQFLGRISYSVYLVHLPILLTVYSALIVGLWHAGLPRVAVAAIAMAITIPVVLLVAMAFDRYVDRLGIRLSKLIGANSSAARREAPVEQTA